MSLVRFIPQSFTSDKNITASNVTMTTPNNGSDKQLEISNLDDYRQQLSDRTAITLLPAIIIISIVMIVALVGNLTVFYVYVKKFSASSTRSAILAIASFDIMACCIAMPGEIVDLRFSYNFPSKILCKCSRMATTMVLIASGITLLVVAVDRYRRVCHPMGNQLTAGQTKKWAFGSLLAAIVFSVPAPIMYGLSWVQTPIQEVHGLECSIDHVHQGSALPLVYNTVLCALFLAVFLAIFVLYILVGKQVFRQGKFRHSVQSGKHQDRVDEKERVNSSGSPVPDVIPQTSFNFNLNESEDDSNRERKRSPPSNSRRQSVMHAIRKSSYGDARTRKTTLMLFMITAVFVISFLPYLILKGIQAIKKDFGHNASDSEVVLYNLFVRSYFFNSVSNCFIYGFCSPKFRKECKKLLFKLLCCWKKS